MTRSTVARRALWLAGLALLMLGPLPAARAVPARAAGPAPTHSLPLALQESLYFYDAEKSGPSRSRNDQPLEWRGDADPIDGHVPLVAAAHTANGTNLSAAFIQQWSSVLNTGGSNTVDLSGGFHDAGDHVKFGLPQSYAASTLGWGVFEFRDQFVATGTLDHALDEMRWFSDYFLRSTFRDPATGNVIAFNYMVGNGTIDHTYWGPPELQDNARFPRPATFATATMPASDQTAGAAAALAVESLIVQSLDPAYAAKSLDAARALYTFSVQNRGLGNSDGFYNSSYDEDELSWAAIWLFIATGTRQYLNDIISVDSTGRYTGWLKRIIATTSDSWNNSWVHSWDTKWGGVLSLLAPLVAGDATIPQAARDAFLLYDRWNIEFWSHVPHANAADTNFLANTPAGFAVLNTWGSARYNTAAQLEALVYRKRFPNDPKSVLFTDWAMGQMNYILGDNPLNRSYEVGFGSTTPGVGTQVGGHAVAASHPHNRAAHGSLTNNMGDPADDRHILWGALVGGPDAADKHNDLTTDFVSNEVAVDYSAAFVGALAGLVGYSGQGQTITSFTPPAEAPETGFFATATDEQESNQRSQVQVTIHNVATHPPHFESDMTARYFFNISEIKPFGQDIGAVTVPVFYDESAASFNQPAKISGPIAWDAANGIYYVEISWVGAQVSNKRDFQFGLVEAQDAQFSTHWDPTNDPSYQGVKAGTFVSTPDPNIPVYLNGVRVFGQEPAKGGSGGGPGPTPSPSPTPTPVVALKAQYQIGQANATSNEVRNVISIVNTGNTPVALSDVLVRYWYNEGSTLAQTYNCDFAVVSCANVTGTFVALSPARSGADHYVQLSFSAGAGTLAPGAATGQIQNRFNKSDFSNFNQTGSWSFDPTKTALTDWNHVTVYYKGQLVSGTEPS